jgi:hypothetical protein
VPVLTEDRFMGRFIELIFLQAVRGWRTETPRR